MCIFFAAFSLFFLTPVPYTQAPNKLNSAPRGLGSSAQDQIHQNLKTSDERVENEQLPSPPSSTESSSSSGPMGNNSSPILDEAYTVHFKSSWADDEEEHGESLCGGFGCLLTCVTKRQLIKFFLLIFCYARRSC